MGYGSIGSRFWFLIYDLASRLMILALDFEFKAILILGGGVYLKKRADSLDGWISGEYFQTVGIDNDVATHKSRRVFLWVAVGSFHEGS